MTTTKIVYNLSLESHLPSSVYIPPQITLFFWDSVWFFLYI